MHAEAETWSVCSEYRRLFGGHMDPIETFKRAALRPKHLAPLLGISRVTASIWLNGHGQPHVILKKKVEQLATLVAKALELNRLPVPNTVHRTEELQYLKTTLLAMKNGT